MTTKAEARLVGREYRNSLSDNEVAIMSKSLCLELVNLVDLVFNGNKMRIQVFDSIAEKHEIDLSSAMSRLSNKYVIDIQSRDETLSRKQYDMIVIPGLAVDLKGNRVGYGGGFYDRFLKEQSKAIKVNVQFDDLIIVDIERESHDILVDYIVTEKRTIRVRN